MSNHTALHQVHVDALAKLVSFSGVLLPLHYGSVLAERKAVRKSAGMFDISHLCAVNIRGEKARDWLRIMLTNDVAKLQDGQVMYSCLCQPEGGVIDDLMVCRLAEDHYRLSVDAARREKDLVWLEAHLFDGVSIEEPDQSATIAVQGPDAVAAVQAALQAMDKPMSLCDMPAYTAQMHGDWYVARTGYTGEDGLEIALPDNDAVSLWKALADKGVSAAGLGARDALRLEAGYGLYGQDIDEQHSPAESGLAHTIDISDENRLFLGREVLEDHKMFGGRFFQIGLILQGKGLLRRGADVELVGEHIGTITSGNYSPSRAASVGLARVSRKFTGSCDVFVRERLQSANITSVPFVPHGLARE